MRGRKAHPPCRKSRSAGSEVRRADHVAVRHVKNREVDEAKIEEIHHEPHYRTVDQVSDSSGKEKDHGDIKRQVPASGRKFCHKDRTAITTAAATRKKNHCFPWRIPKAAPRFSEYKSSKTP